MTANTSFKRRVRERMARTGERYMTARLHVLAARPAEPDDAVDPDGLLPGWSRTGGVQPDLAATANALAHVGVRGVGGGPVDEIDVLALAGGIGFMYALFEYEGYGPLLTLTTRNDSMPDVSVGNALRSSGVEHEVRETTGPPTAARHLAAAVDDQRPVLASVDESRLPAHATGEPAGGGLPRVVGIVGRNDDGALLVDDEAPQPVVVGAEDLAAARAALPRTRHRLVVVGDAGDRDPTDAALDGLRLTVAGYDDPPARSFTRNVGTAGLRTWSGAMTGTGARSWSRVFADPAHRAVAFDRVAACIDEDLTAPGASRGLWAEALERTTSSTDLPRLADVAGAVRRSEERWIEIAALARTADPEADPGATFAAMASLVDAVADLERALVDDLAEVLDGLPL